MRQRLSMTELVTAILLLAALTWAVVQLGPIAIEWLRAAGPSGSDRGQTGVRPGGRGGAGASGFAATL